MKKQKSSRNTKAIIISILVAIFGAALLCAPLPTVYRDVFGKAIAGEFKVSSCVAYKAGDGIWCFGAFSPKDSAYNRITFVNDGFGHPLRAVHSSQVYRSGDVVDATARSITGSHQLTTNTYVVLGSTRQHWLGGDLLYGFCCLLGLIITIAGLSYARLYFLESKGRL